VRHTISEYLPTGNDERHLMNDAGTATGKVVVHRTMSLDGFIAGAIARSAR
jgi:hypothetical protein